MLAYLLWCEIYLWENPKITTKPHQHINWVNYPLIDFTQLKTNYQVSDFLKWILSRIQDIRRKLFMRTHWNHRWTWTPLKNTQFVEVRTEKEGCCVKHEQSGHQRKWTQQKLLTVHLNLNSESGLRHNAAVGFCNLDMSWLPSVWGELLGDLCVFQVRFPVGHFPGDGWKGSKITECKTKLVRHIGTNNINCQ